MPPKNSVRWVCRVHDTQVGHYAIDACHRRHEHTYVYICVWVATHSYNRTTSTRTANASFINRYDTLTQCKHTAHARTANVTGVQTHSQSSERMPGRIRTRRIRCCPSLHRSPERLRRTWSPLVVHTHIHEPIDVAWCTRMRTGDRCTDGGHTHNADGRRMHGW